MEIYKYLNSPDISQYYAENDIQLNGLQAAFVIWLSQKITVEEKHQLYKSIIQTMPDMELKNCSKKSLHSLLRSYIDIETNLLKQFYENKETKSYWKYPDGDFMSFDDLVVSIQEETDVNSVEKIFHSDQERYADISMSVRLNKDGKVMEIFALHKSFFTPKQKEVYTYFCKADIRIPLSFQKGDLVNISDFDPIVHPEATMLYLDMYCDDNLLFDYGCYYDEDYVDYYYNGYDDYNDDEDDEEYFENRVYCSGNNHLRMVGICIAIDGTILKTCSEPCELNFIYRKKNLSQQEKLLSRIGKYIRKNTVDADEFVDILGKYANLREKLRNR